MALLGHDDAFTALSAFGLAYEDLSWHTVRVTEHMKPIPCHNPLFKLQILYLTKQ